MANNPKSWFGTHAKGGEDTPAAINVPRIKVEGFGEYVVGAENRPAPLTQVESYGWNTTNGSVVNVRRPQVMWCEDFLNCTCETCTAWRAYDGALLLTKGDRVEADKVFERARKAWKERHALQAAVHEAGAVDGAGADAQQDDESVVEGRDQAGGGDHPRGGDA